MHLITIAPLVRGYWRLSLHSTFDNLASRAGSVRACFGLNSFSTRILTSVPTKALMPPSFKSKYVGVCWYRPTKKWMANITIKGKVVNLGYYSCEGDAARAFDARAALLNRPVNFPEPGQALAVKRGAHGISSRYMGVCWDMHEEKWVAHIEINGVQHKLGYSIDEETAARAYDKSADSLGRPVNFPFRNEHEQALKRGASKYREVHWNPGENLWQAVGLKQGKRTPLGAFKKEEDAARAVDDHLVSLSQPRKNFPGEGEYEVRQASTERMSQYVGVSRSSASNRWDAKILIDGKTVRMGTFDDEEEAARAYDEKAATLGRPVNFPKGGQKQAVKAGSSKYRGVKKRGKRWSASIKTNGEVTSLGSFASEEEAARKYDQAAAPLGRPINFPLSLLGVLQEGPAVRTFWFHEAPEEEDDEEADGETKLEQGRAAFLMASLRARKTQRKQRRTNLPALSTIAPRLK